MVGSIILGAKIIDATEKVRAVFEIM